ncbi:17.3 kDa class II heat shock protein-like [Vigna angularis]|uniref:17.3 kDa class II heat shock protein-like n=1 Tax=Phaseolus angularis TaxID=3914 RepID=UPI0022B38AED|nr:17.3 kDa class II heat shock protein-like [Vigna angularis]
MATTPTDMKEYPNSYAFVIDMPGLKGENIKVQVEEDSVLVISDKRKREMEKVGTKYLRMERRVGKFMRNFKFPDNAKTDAISARYQDGEVEEDSVLVISDERKREMEKVGTKYLRMERRVGKFMRKFKFPDNANTDAISARYQDGEVCRGSSYGQLAYG